MFRGISVVSMDARGRLALPARFREPFDDSVDKHFVITIDTAERCLLLYKEPDWNEVQLRLETLSNIRESARLLQRLLIGHATDVEVDAQGRILVPQILRDFASLEKKLVLMGQTNKIEIWSEESWLMRREEWLLDSRKNVFEEVQGYEGLSV